MKLISVQNEEELSRIAAELVLAKLQSSDLFVLGLATGSTPLGMYRNLVKYSSTGSYSFAHVHTVNLDEYVGLSAEDPHSYHTYMKTNLFDHVDLPPEQTHLPNGHAESLEDECLRYEKVIKNLGGIDFQVLGIGENGHIGFNEPGTDLNSRTHVVRLTESTLHANAKYFPDSRQPTKAITMGVATILESKEILLLAAGERKAKAVKKLFEGELNKKFPVTALTIHPNVTVIADTGARKLINKES